MRSVYFNQDNSKMTAENIMELFGEEFIHLKKVLRVKLNQIVLAQNGNGLCLLLETLEINKKSMTFKILKKKNFKRDVIINLLLGTPKKDAFETICMYAQSLGINRIIPISTSFSEYEAIMNDRIEKILINSLKQSNAIFLTKISESIKIDQLDLERIRMGRCVIFHPTTFVQTKTEAQTSSLNKCDEIYYGIGPEGGWSDLEIKFFNDKLHAEFRSFSTPILKAVAAVIYGHSLVQKTAACSLSREIDSFCHL